MATPCYVPEESVPLPPPDAEIISTACDYCIVACGYKVCRWPENWIELHPDDDVARGIESVRLFRSA